MDTSPKPQIEHDSEMERRCTYHNIRDHGNFKNLDVLLKIDVIFAKAVDFTTLFICNILHDYFKVANGDIVFTVREIQFLCELISEGMRADYQDIYLGVTALIERLKHLRYGDQYKIKSFEKQLSHYFYEGGYYRRTNENLLSGSNRNKVSADACRVDKKQSSLCMDYSGLKSTHKYRNIVTIATKLDSGFMPQHIDYKYCQYNQDYVLVDASICMLVGDYTFSNVVYKNNGNTVSLRYCNSGSYYIENDLYHLKDFYRTKFDDVMNMYSGDKEKRTRMFHLFINKFHGDFGQILYSHAASVEKLLDMRGGEGIYMLTDDKMMTLMSVMLLNIDIYTSYEKKLVKLRTLKRSNTSIKTKIYKI